VGGAIFFEKYLGGSCPGNFIILGGGPVFLGGCGILIIAEDLVQLLG
jgi:hypothetical protein